MPCIETLIHDIKIRYRLKQILRRKTTLSTLNSLVRHLNTRVTIHIANPRWSITVRGRKTNEVFVTCKEIDGKYVEALKIKINEIF